MEACRHRSSVGPTSCWHASWCCRSDRQGGCAESDQPHHRHGKGAALKWWRAWPRSGGGCAASFALRAHTKTKPVLAPPQVANVKVVSPPELLSMLDQIGFSVNAVAGAWWEIEWASQQSQWDNLVMLSNTVVLQISQILPRCVGRRLPRLLQLSEGSAQTLNPQHTCLPSSSSYPQPSRDGRPLLGVPQPPGRHGACGAGHLPAGGGAQGTRPGSRVWRVCSRCLPG